jgi:LacI family transcriptional regulator
VTGPQNLAFVHFQIEGFRQTLAEHDLSTDETLVFESDLTQRGGYGAAHVLLSQEQPPTAILASSDLMALGVMSAAQDQGLVVGQDIAVAGFDDIPAAESSYPTLTTIRQPAAQTGRLLGQMLVDSACGKPLHQAQVLLPPSLIIRQSTSLDLWL